MGWRWFRIGFFERGVFGIFGLAGWKNAYVHSHIVIKHRSLAGLLERCCL